MNKKLGIITNQGTTPFLSIVCGEIALMCFYFKLFTANTFLPVIWVMIITFFVYLVTHMLLLWREKALHIYKPEWLYDRHVWLFFGIFLLAMDFWAWGKVEPIFLGVPLWVGYFVILSALQTLIMIYLINKKKSFTGYEFYAESRVQGYITSV